MANEVVDQDKPEAEASNLTPEQAEKRMQAAVAAQAAAGQRTIKIDLSPQEREHMAESDLFGPKAA